jgi:hypothetical protein
MARPFFSPFRPPSPRRFLSGFRDLGFFLRTRTRTDYVIAAIAAAMTVFIIFAFWHDSSYKEEPQIVYVQNWRADRPDSEIVAEQKKERVEKRQAEAERRAFFEKIQKKSSFWL